MGPVGAAEQRSDHYLQHRDVAGSEMHVRYAPKGFGATPFMLCIR